MTNNMLTISLILHKPYESECYNGFIRDRYRAHAAHNSNMLQGECSLDNSSDVSRGWNRRTRFRPRSKTALFRHPYLIVLSETLPTGRIIVTWFLCKWPTRLCCATSTPTAGHDISPATADVDISMVQDTRARGLWPHNETTHARRIHADAVQQRGLTVEHAAFAHCRSAFAVQCDSENIVFEDITFKDAHATHYTNGA